jgi:hypothetical protein
MGPEQLNHFLEGMQIQEYQIMAGTGEKHKYSVEDFVRTVMTANRQYSSPKLS